MRFLENPEKYQMFKEFPFKIDGTKIEMKKIVSGRERNRRSVTRGAT